MSDRIDRWVGKYCFKHQPLLESVESYNIFNVSLQSQGENVWFVYKLQYVVVVVVFAVAAVGWVDTGLVVCIENTDMIIFILML